MLVVHRENSHLDNNHSLRTKWIYGLINESNDDRWRDLYMQYNDGDCSTRSIDSDRCNDWIDIWEKKYWNCNRDQWNNFDHIREFHWRWYDYRFETQEQPNCQNHWWYGYSLQKRSRSSWKRWLLADHWKLYRDYSLRYPMHWRISWKKKHSMEINVEGGWNDYRSAYLSGSKSSFFFSNFEQKNFVAICSIDELKRINVDCRS